MQFLERKRDLLEEDVEELHEKIKRLRKERVIATEADKKFKLDKQIEEETARLEEIHRQINGIEQEIRREDEKEPELISFLPFTNRNTEWEKVVDWPQGQYYLMDGPAGFGKTVLLYKIKEEFNRREWLCAYVSLKEYGTVAQIADHIAQKLEAKTNVLLEDHRRIGAELGEALAHRRREIGAEGVALLFDVEKEPWEQLIKTLRCVVEDFIPGVYTGLTRNSDYFTEKPLSFRVVIAGRYLIPRIEDFNQKYKFKHIQLRPLDYEAIREICRMCVPDDEARDEFAAHLLFYSAGHPHCIEQILRKFEKRGRPSAFFKSHRDDIERVAFLEANRVYNSITRSWRRVFDISCLYRRLDHFLLQRFLEEGWVWHGMVEDEYDLFDKLKLSYLVDWADELRAHLSDGVTRRLLHIRLRLDLQQAQFEERCRKAETLCMECLDRTVEYSPYWAVETLFEYLQANVARIENQAGRQALCKEFFQTKLPEVLNMLKQVYNPNLLKNSLIGILEEDWEFQFTLNYYLRDDHYDDTPYQKLLGYIRQHQVRHTQSNSSVNKDPNA